MHEALGSTASTTKKKKSLLNLYDSQSIHYKRGLKDTVYTGSGFNQPIKHFWFKRVLIVRDNNKEYKRNTYK